MWSKNITQSVCVAIIPSFIKLLQNIITYKNRHWLWSLKSCQVSHWVIYWCFPPYIFLEISNLIRNDIDVYVFTDGEVLCSLLLFWNMPKIYKAIKIKCGFLHCEVESVYVCSLTVKHCTTTYFIWIICKKRHKNPNHCYPWCALDSRMTQRKNYTIYLLWLRTQISQNKLDICHRLYTFTKVNPSVHPS